MLVLAPRDTHARAPILTAPHCRCRPWQRTRIISCSLWGGLCWPLSSKRPRRLARC